MIDADDLRMIHEAAERLFAQHCDRRILESAAGGAWPSILWDEVEAAGLTRALVSEDRAGAGLPVGDGLGLISIAAQYGAPIPFAETMVAAWLLDRAGLDVPTGPLTLMTAKGADRVPWGALSTLVCVSGDQLCVVPQGTAKFRRGSNLAGEPRDAMSVEMARPVASPLVEVEVEALLAGVRAIQIGGALVHVTELAANYAGERIQFGKPIARFQAIQQQLAVLATQAAVAVAAGDLARDAIGRGALMPGCAIAKARAGEAAGIGAAIAHQVHGAIGFTLEHDLQFWTKRLWSWRDEYGQESRWNAQFGRTLLEAGGDQLWSTLTEI